MLIRILLLGILLSVWPSAAFPQVPDIIQQVKALTEALKGVTLNPSLRVELDGLEDQVLRVRGLDPGSVIPKLSEAQKALGGDAFKYPTTELLSALESLDKQIVDVRPSEAPERLMYRAKTLEGQLKKDDIPKSPLGVSLIASLSALSSKIAGLDVEPPLSEARRLAGRFVVVLPNAKSAGLAEMELQAVRNEIAKFDARSEIQKLTALLTDMTARIKALDKKERGLATAVQAALPELIGHQAERDPAASLAFLMKETEKAVDLDAKGALLEQPGGVAAAAAGLNGKLQAYLKQAGPRIEILEAWTGDLLALDRLNRNGKLKLSAVGSIGKLLGARFCPSTMAFRALCDKTSQCPAAVADDAGKFSIAKLCGFDPVPHADPRIVGSYVVYDCVYPGEQIKKSYHATIHHSSSAVIRCQDEALWNAQK